MPNSIYDYNKSQLTQQYMGSTEKTGYQNAEDLEMGVSNNADHPLYSINN